jgi:hypothetical protein
MCGRGPVISKDLTDAFQKPGVGSGGKIQNCHGEKTEELVIVDARLRCTPFDWISTWKASSSSPYAGHASESYLLKRPEESDNIHDLKWWFEAEKRS